MRMTLSRGPEDTIAIPERLARVLGDPGEVEVEEVSGGLLIRAEAVTSPDVQLRAIREFRANGTEDAEFSDEELLDLRKSQRAVEEAETKQILAGFRDGDLPA